MTPKAPGSGFVRLVDDKYLSVWVREGQGNSRWTDRVNLTEAESAVLKRLRLETHRREHIALAVWLAGVPGLMILAMIVGNLWFGAIVTPLLIVGIVLCVERNAIQARNRFLGEMRRLVRVAATSDEESV